MGVQDLFAIAITFPFLWVTFLTELAVSHCTSIFLSFMDVHVSRHGCINLIS